MHKLDLLDRAGHQPKMASAALPATPTSIQTALVVRPSQPPVTPQLADEEREGAKLEKEGIKMQGAAQKKGGTKEAKEKEEQRLAKEGEKLEAAGDKTAAAIDKKGICLSLQPRRAAPRRGISVRRSEIWHDVGRVTRCVRLCMHVRVSCMLFVHAWMYTHMYSTKPDNTEQTSSRKKASVPDLWPVGTCQNIRTQNFKCL